MSQFIQHVQQRAKQEGASTWVGWAGRRISTRMANGLFIVLWMLFFGWVPLIFGRWWRRLLLRFVLAKCGSRLSVSTGVHIEYPWRIRVGDDVWIGRGCQLEGMGGIEIGDHVMVALQTLLQSAGHELGMDNNVRTETIVSAPIIVGNNVWLGARSMVRYGVTIGENAIVGMGAVVVKDVPAGASVGGVPAKPLGLREDSDA